MRVLSNVSLQPLPQTNEDLLRRSRVLLDGSPQAPCITGVVLEAALRWRELYLLFVTDDIPQEDLLHITLWDRHFHPLDSAVIGAMYSTGRFQLLGLQGDDAVGFRFIGDTDWSVQVFPRPRFRLPLLSEPAGVSRPLGFSRHFIVRGKPKPQD
jgi:hypothetical protein